MSELVYKTEIKRDHQLLSDDVQEIIRYRPHWFIRRGNLIFLVIISTLLMLAYFIKYPDVVKASARLSAINAPKMLESKIEGKLDKLLVKNLCATSVSFVALW